MGRPAGAGYKAKPTMNVTFICYSYRTHKEELSQDSHISRLRKELGENQQKLALLEEVDAKNILC